MMILTYFIKVTLLWTVFLGAYLLLYRKSTAFTLNRIYLLSSLLLGLALPLMPLHFPGNVQQVQALRVIDNGWRTVDRATVLQPARQNGGAFPWRSIVQWVYCSGALLALLSGIREIILILRAAVYGQYQTAAGHRIFSSRQKAHAPFSFMGWIFIARPDQYKENELAYILRHEDAHNARKHWLDMILAQLICTLCWFHPLVWYFRYLLKLTHEYEADQVAAEGNAYEYGHFLLAQTLLKGTPAIAHSFHFSPIKYRITMLTNPSSKRSWKYLATLPLVLCCVLVMAKANTTAERLKKGNTTTFKGNTFTWQEREPRKVVAGTFGSDDYYVKEVPQQPVIDRMNGDTVFMNDMVVLPAQFRQHNLGFYDYINEEFKKRVPNPPDSIQQIQINNIVVDADGKVVYYDLTYFGISRPQDPYPALDGIVADIIESSPAWMPATQFGKPVPAFVEFAGAIVLKNVTFQIRPLTKKEAKQERAATELKLKK